LFDCFPASFEEVHIEVIRARSFPILHLIDNFTNLFFKHWLVKIVVVFPGYKIRNELGEFVNELRFVDERLLCYAKEVLN